MDTGKETITEHAHGRVITIENTEQHLSRSEGYLKIAKLLADKAINHPEAYTALHEFLSADGTEDQRTSRMSAVFQWMLSVCTTDPTAMLMFMSSLAEANNALASQNTFETADLKHHA